MNFTPILRSKTGCLGSSFKDGLSVRALSFTQIQPTFISFEAGKNALNDPKWPYQKAKHSEVPAPNVLPNSFANVSTEWWPPWCPWHAYTVPSAYTVPTPVMLWSCRVKVKESRWAGLTKARKTPGVYSKYSCSQRGTDRPSTLSCHLFTSMIFQSFWEQWSQVWVKQNDELTFFL